MLPAATPAIGQLETVLDNLALAATNNMAVLQQLASANLALMVTIGTLTAANKKLVDAVAHSRGTQAPGTPAVTPGGGGRSTKTPHPGNYCWTHGHRISKDHTSSSCANKVMGHRDDATAANILGSSEKDKGWDSART